MATVASKSKAGSILGRGGVRSLTSLLDGDLELDLEFRGAGEGRLEELVNGLGLTSRVLDGPGRNVVRAYS
jgi:hypothetical protein